MFRSKVDIDRHVEDIFRKCPTLAQRVPQFLKIASLYYKVKDYETAKTYAQNYLSEKPNDASGHEVLGQCYEGLNNKIKASEEYKMSASLNMNNSNLLKKLANLLIEDDVPLDLIKDKYWIERVDQILVNQPAQRFKFKEKLLKLSQNNVTDSKQYEELLAAELESNPKSLDVRLKILKLYKNKGQIKEAFSHAVNIDQMKIWTTSQFIWYSQIVDLCKSYESKFIDQNNADNDDKLNFYKKYIEFLENYLKFGLKEKDLSLVQLEKHLVLFDESLFKFRNLFTNFDATSRAEDTLFVHHMFSQLCFYTLNIILRKTHNECHDSESFKDKIHQSASLIVLGMNPGFVLAYQSTGASSHAVNIVDYQNAAKYRISQCLLFLNILKKYGFLYDEHVESSFKSKDWLDFVHSYVLVGGNKSFLKTFASKMLPSSVDGLRLINAASLRTEHVVATELMHPNSLHHLTWLGVSLILENNTTLTPPFYKVNTLSKLQFACQNIFLTRMNLCVLDVDAFLYASVFCALHSLQLHQHESGGGSGSSSTSILSTPPLLLADVNPNNLVSSSQAAWWKTVHEIVHQNNTSLSKDQHLIFGLELIRNVSSSTLHVAILVYLARMFASRASDLSSNSTSQSSNIKKEIKALEVRSQHYWECALPSLQRLEKNLNISGVNDQLFRYHGEPITSIEASNMVEEGKCMLGCFKMNDGKLNEASNIFKPLKSSFAKYNLAKIYVKLAEEELHNPSSDTNNRSILNMYRSTTPHMYTILLEKSKDCLMKAQARLDTELTNSYPDLGNKILDLLTDIELKLEQIDGSNEHSFNISSSSFIQQRDVSTKAEYMSPSLNQKHQNSLLRNNQTRGFYASEQSPNVNSLVTKTLETQMELVLEKLKRLQDNVDNENDGGSVHRLVSRLEDKVDTMGDRLESMHSKYVNILDSIKDLVQDKTDVIQNITENLAALSTKVNVLMGNDIDDNYVLNPDEYPDINPDYYSGSHQPTGHYGKSTSVAVASGVVGSSVGGVSANNYYGQTGAVGGGSSGLPFSSGQTLPNFYNQMATRTNNSVLPPVVMPTQAQQTLPYTSSIASVPGLLPPNISNIIPVPSQIVPQSQPKVSPKPISSKLPQNAPQNVVITTSDKLPTGPPLPAPQLSVLIPPQHLLANKSKVGTNTAIPNQFGALNPNPVNQFGPVPSNTIPVIPNQFGPGVPTANPVVPKQFGSGMFGDNSTLSNNFGFGIFGMSSNPSGNSSGQNSFTESSIFGGKSSGFSSPAFATTTTPAKNLATPNSSTTPSSKDNTPHKFQIQMPSQIVDLEKSPIIRESLAQNVDSSDDEAADKEHDPMPDFKPIIPLPDEVVVTTGEENETVLFEKRAKLYRYVTKEWKERGLGLLRILQNKNTGKVRILMRREIVHKICANHFLHPDMTLTPMTKSNQAYIWFAQDYADEVVSEDKLCAKFKTPEDAELFKKVFNEGKLINSEMSNLDTNPKAKETTASSNSTTNAAAAANNKGFSKELLKVKAGSWECKDCYVTNDATRVHCLACNGAKPGDKTDSIASTNKYQLGGLTFSSTPVLKKDEPKQSSTNKDIPIKSTSQISQQIPPSSSTPGQTPFSSFKFSSVQTNTPTPQVNPFSKLSTFKFGVEKSGVPETGTPTTTSTTNTSSTENFSTLKNLLTTPVKSAANTVPFSSSTTGVDFAALAKSNTQSPFSFSTPPSFKGFEGAGTPLFAKSTLTPPNKNDSEDKDGHLDTSGNNEDSADFVPTAEFQPVVPLPELVNVVTGEENQSVLFEDRCKLLRFDSDAKEWKERGIGNMKILKDDNSGAVRLVMRREQVFKVCCNQRMTSGFELKPLATSDKAWSWIGQDYSEGEVKSELFAIRFKTSEQAVAFKDKVYQIVEELKANPSPNKSNSFESNKSVVTSNIDNKPALSEMFKPKPGSWECPGCLVRNNAFVTSCPACNTVKPGCKPPPASPEKSAPTGGTFTFGVPKNANDTTKPAVAIPQFKPSTDVPSTGFTFGMPFAPITNDLSVSNSTPEKSDPQTENTKFSFGSSKFSFSGLKPITPSSPGTGHRTESESEADTTYEEEENDNIHFQPVVPLPDKIEPTTGEENETVLYQHRAKLFRFHQGDWKERGVGDIKILKHNQTGRIRFIMRREPIGKMCLNHYLQLDLDMRPKDEKTWLWAALDYSDGEWAQENFALRFKNSEIAQDFKKFVDDALEQLVKDSPDLALSTEKATRRPSDDEIQIVYEKNIALTEEEKALTLKYQLPANYYEYKNKPDCPGCIGCDTDSMPDISISNASPSLKLTITNSTQQFVAPFSFTNKQHLNVLKQSSTPNETLGSQISFESGGSPILKDDKEFKSPFSVVSSEKSLLDSTSFPALNANIFGISSDSNNASKTNTQATFDNSAGNPFRRNVFGSTTNTSGNLFGGKSNLFGASPNQSPQDSNNSFGINVPNLFDGTGKESVDNSQKSVLGFEKSIFGGDNKILFGQSSQFGAKPLFGSNNQSVGSFFGPKSSDPLSLSKATVTPQSIFGGVSQPTFGIESQKLSESNPLKSNIEVDERSKGSDAVGSAAAIPAPSFLQKLDTAPSFADLTQKIETKPFSTAPTNFQWEGAGTSVFTSGLNSSNNSSSNLNLSKSEIDPKEEDTEDNDDGDANHDPHFDPIIPLPDLVEVKTGEEDEEKLFSERCKLYRYDEDTKEWKERGVGEIKLLFHPEKQTYRILMRREQIHKTVANFLLWPEFEVKPMSTSDKAWIMTVMNLAEDYPSPELEKLAVRFKSCDLAIRFKEEIEKSIEQVRQIKTSQSLSTTQEEEGAGYYEGDTEEVNDGVEEVDVEEEEVAEEEEAEEDDEDYDEDDDDEYNNFDDIGILIEHPTTLLKRPNSQNKWETIGSGTAKLRYDADTHGYRVEVQIGEQDLALDTVITQESTFQRKGKAIVWRGEDFTLDPPSDQEIMLKFSTDEMTENFLQFLDEGTSLAAEVSNTAEEDS